MRSQGLPAESPKPAPELPPGKALEAARPPSPAWLRMRPRTTWACAAAALVSVLLPVWLLSRPSGHPLGIDSPIPNAGRVLLVRAGAAQLLHLSRGDVCSAGLWRLQVTAHPDDETIFFSPSINALRRAGNEVFLLCFTNGAVAAALHQGSATAGSSSSRGVRRQLSRLGAAQAAGALSSLRSSAGENGDLAAGSVVSPGH